ncbi:hypothetical protein ACFL5O_08235 [Myxococcota bacterium]
MTRRARAAAKKVERFVGKLRQRGSPPAASPPAAPAPKLKPGDLVRVHSAEYVRSTLDRHGSLRGCTFSLGMYQYCGQERRVLRVVERFFDEPQFRMLKARNMVLLEGIYCDGSSQQLTQGCDRMCFYFWRTEWLEKIKPQSQTQEGESPAGA